MSDGASDWLPLLTRGLAGDAAALAAVPKTDLHAHGLLSAPLAAFERVRGTPLPPAPARFPDFDAFNLYIAEHLLPVLTDARSVRAVVRAAFERLVADGVVYAEMSFDLLAPEFIGLSAAQFAALLAEEIERVAADVVVAPDIGINRAVPVAEALPLLREFIATGVFRSVDLYGDERLGDVRDFVPLYRLAGEHGLKRKAHAGELCGAACVRESVEALDLDAVHHGVRAAEDPEVTAWLAERGTVLHVCPTSNYSLGICDALSTHPARRLFDAGCRLTVNSDDFTLFGASVCDELRNLAAMGFSPEEIARVIRTGLGERPS